jgi:hypothetical protein
MTALLLTGLLLVDPAPPAPEPDPATAAKPAPPEEGVVRPAVPVPEAGFQIDLRDSRQPEWGFTVAVGVGAITDGDQAGVAIWGGVRRWLGPNVIVGGLVSYQRFDRLVDLAVLARIEIATRTDRERLFPTFSVYAGAGPELFSGPSGASGGMRLVVGVHLPTLWSGINGAMRPSNDVVLALMLLLPLAVEVQFRTGGGAVASSTALVVALAL